MAIIKKNLISLCFLVILGVVLATVPQQQDYNSIQHGGNGEYDHSADKTNNKYQPYGFGYEVEDGWGNSQYRHEKGSGPWEVSGSYGYKDAWGVYRHVDYVADKWGFRANVKTNEPGTAPKDPAAVKMNASPMAAGNWKSGKSESAENSGKGSYNTYDKKGSMKVY